jgi:DNA-binding FrmR family transcriptional regulator
MTPMETHSEALKNDLNRRLRRIEGQSRGVQKMLYDDRDCQEIVQQLKAMQAAVRNATALYMRAYAKDCLLRSPDQHARETVVDEMMDLVVKLT